MGQVDNHFDGGNWSWREEYCQVATPWFIFEIKNLFPADCISLKQSPTATCVAMKKIKLAEHI